MKSTQVIVFILCMILIGLSCRALKEEQTISGAWESIGYGYIIDIDQDSITFYDKTEISCTPKFVDHLSEYEGRLSMSGEQLSLVDGINVYYFKNLNEIPDLCQNDLIEEERRDPFFNFEVLASTFNDHYAYFDLRNVNWDSLYQATKNNITSQTSEAELFVIMEDMLNSFSDGHIGLDAPRKIVEEAKKLRAMVRNETEEENEKRYGSLEIADLVSNDFLGANKLTKNSRLVEWGLIEGNIGYLQVNVMMGHADLNLPDSLKGNAYWQKYFGHFENMTSEAHTREEVKGINKTLDLAFVDLKKNDALILDVRFNGGGKDEVALEIIKRFNPNQQEVFNKKARLGNGFTKPNRIILDANDDAYVKPVFLLTSRQSASATEIMVLSSMNIEHITRIGTNTEGVFSDVLDKSLPNGWEFGLSNEVYLDNDGLNYEGIGIHAHIDLNYPEDVQDFYRSIVDGTEDDKNEILHQIFELLRRR